VIDVSHKPTTLRSATARAVLHAAPASIAQIREGTVPKGDPLEVARAATAVAVKSTPLMIPYCHPVRIDWVHTEFEIAEGTIQVDVTVKAVDRTGVEVEAMTGASTAALVLYDMLKMLDDTLWIEGVRLLDKRGGKTDRRGAHAEKVDAAILISSDSIAKGEKRDISGLIIRRRLEAAGLRVVDQQVVPDDIGSIVRVVREWIDQDGVGLIVTTGSTGFGPRDRIPEAMDQLIEREAPGIMEAARMHGQRRNPYSMLSRGRAGARGDSLIINLPGSQGGVGDALDALIPGVLHAFEVLRGGGHESDPREGEDA
jgi:molybdenum cofactor biosynthesis protein MoaC